MKKILIIISLCLFVVPIIIHANTFKYINEQYHYSFTVPNNWEEIPKLIINATMNQLLKDTSTFDPNEFRAGFHVKNQETFQYPYILINQYEIDTPYSKQLIKMFEDNITIGRIKEGMDEGINEMKQEISSLISNASIEKPLINENQKTISFNMEMDVINVGKVKALTTLFLGKNNVVQLNFYSLETDYLNNLIIFNKIINSFEYEEGYKYGDNVVSKNNEISILGKIIIGGIVGAIMGLFQSLKKKRK